MQKLDFNVFFIRPVSSLSRVRPAVWSVDQNPAHMNKQKKLGLFVDISPSLIQGSNVDTTGRRWLLGLQGLQQHWGNPRSLNFFRHMGSMTEADTSDGEGDFRQILCLLKITRLRER